MSGYPSALHPSKHLPLDCLNADEELGHQIQVIEHAKLPKAFKESIQASSIVL